MAKKKETLMPEERLQATLVPESEQPYKVPANWYWVRLKASINLYNGDRGINYPSKKDYQSSGVPFINAGDIVDGELNEAEFNYISEEKYNALRAGKIQQGDILYCLRGSLGKTAIVHQKFKGAISSSLCILRANESLLKEYLYYLLCSNVIGHQQILAENGSAQPNLSAASVMDYMIPLSPLAEQHRIVDRIESLFAKLDESKQKVKDTLDSFEIRKAAILHKAFIGELTSQWRKDHGVGMESWKKSRFDEVATIKSNLVNPLDFPDLPHIAPDNIEKKTGVLLEYHTVSEDGVTSGKHRFYPGQILYSKIRPYLSKVVVVDFDGLCSADMYPIEAKGNAKCLWYYMLSEEFLGQASSAGSRSVLPKINQKELSALTVVLPTLKDEQEEIVRILDDMFAKEQQAKESTERVLEQIDLIKKAILARAFRGELGTNDPSEESAVELVKRVLAVEPPPKTRAKAVSIPREVEEQLKSALERKIIKLYYPDFQSLPINTLMEVSSKKFEVLESIRNLEQRGIIKKLPNGNYKLVR